MGDHKDKDLAIGMGGCNEMEERGIRDEEVMDTLCLEMQMKPPLTLPSGLFHLTVSKITKGHAYIYKQ